jgi:hypothetical protein
MRRHPRLARPGGELRRRDARWAKRRRGGFVRGEHLDRRGQPAMGFFIDERADAVRTASRHVFFAGQAGSWPAVFAELIKDVRGIELAPIDFEIADDLAHSRVEVPRGRPGAAPRLSPGRPLKGSAGAGPQRPRAEVGPRQVATWATAQENEVEAFGFKWSWPAAQASTSRSTGQDRTSADLSSWTTSERPGLRVVGSRFVKPKRASGRRRSRRALIVRSDSQWRRCGDAPFHGIGALSAGAASRSSSTTLRQSIEVFQSGKGCRALRTTAAGRQPANPASRHVRPGGPRGTSSTRLTTCRTSVLRAGGRSRCG